MAPRSKEAVSRRKCAGNEALCDDASPVWDTAMRREMGALPRISP
jgi:hypothetical protein